MIASTLSESAVGMLTKALIGRYLRSKRCRNHPKCSRKSPSASQALHKLLQKAPKALLSRESGRGEGYTISMAKLANRMLKSWIFHLKFQNYRGTPRKVEFSPINSYKILHLWGGDKSVSFFLRGEVGKPPLFMKKSIPYFVRELFFRRGECLAERDWNMRSLFLSTITSILPNRWQTLMIETMRDKSLRKLTVERCFELFCAWFSVVWSVLERLDSVGNHGRCVVVLCRFPGFHRQIVTGLIQEQWIPTAQTGRAPENRWANR